MIDFGLVDEAVDDTTHVVSLHGEIDALTAPQLGRRLFGLADEGKRASWWTSPRSPSWTPPASACC